MKFTDYEFEDNEAYNSVVDTEIKIDTNYFLECPTTFTRLFSQELKVFKEYTTMKQKIVDVDKKENFQADVIQEVQYQIENPVDAVAPEGIGELRNYKKVNPALFNDLFKKLGLQVGRFHGSMVMTLNRYELKKMDFESYVFSKKLDGIRGWLIILGNKVYFQDRKSFFYYICEAEIDTEYVFDCELIRYKGASDNTFVLYDIVWFRNRPQYDKIFVDRIGVMKCFELEKVISVANSFHGRDQFIFQKFYTLDTFQNVDMHEGVVFEYLYGMYEFKATRHLLSWKKSPRTVDLMCKDGKLYSAYYNKNKTLRELRYEGEIFTFEKFRKDAILECYPRKEILDKKKGSKRYFLVSRERKDKNFPNAAYVVDEVLAENKNVSYLDICQEFRKYIRVYGDGIQYSLYPICKQKYKEMIQIRYDDVYLYCVIYKCPSRLMSEIVDGPKKITNQTSNTYYDACGEESSDIMEFDFQ